MINLQELYTVEITDMTAEGAGVGKTDGFTLFVKDGVIGDKLSVKIDKLKKNYAFASIAEILEASPLRLEPKCNHFGQCGGCTLQHMEYSEQTKIKHKKVIENLRRIGGINADYDNLKMIPAQQTFNYRNNAQFVIGKEGGVGILGFYQRNSHDLQKIENCDLVHESHREIFAILSNFIKETGISVYDGKTGKGLLRHAIYRIGFKTGEKMLCLVINGDELPNSKNLIKKLSQAEGFTNLSININKAKSSVIMGKETKTLWGSDCITDYLGNYKFEISPNSFFQINPVQTEVLYDKIVELADFSPADTVADLYCGIGSISLYISQYVSMVYGIEISPDAVKNAKRNAEMNDVGNTEFTEGSAEGKFSALKELKPNIIILDPPRKGCNSQLLEQIINSPAEKIIYVSCDPATLARDLKYLTEKGFEFVRGYAIDCFCMTMHTETVVLMTKKHMFS